MEQKQNNPFIEEMKKFDKAQVEVHYYDSEGIKVIEGIVKCLDHYQKGVVIMTDDEKIYIPRYIMIKRKRDKTR